MCTVSTFPQKLFRVHPVLWIHSTQAVPAANPCLRGAAGTACDSHQYCDYAVSAWAVPVLQALSNQLDVNESVCRVV